jgi:DNA-binding XRE family transcriptional regulator
MKIDQILSKYSLTRDTTTDYINAITRMNQTETAEELDVSRDTINRYKNAFVQMTREERALVIASLTQEKLLEQATED